MTRLFRSVLATLPAVTLTAAAQVPPPIIEFQFPHAAPSSSIGAGQVFISWTAQDVRCAGVPVVFTRPPAAMPALGWSTPGNGMKPVSYSFTIDQTGRPLDIKRIAKGYVVASEDLTPALAVSQFAPGAAHAECTLTFVPAPQPVAAAPVTSVMAYTMFPGQRPTAEMWARVKPAGSTCYDPAPQVRNRAFPNFDAIPKQPGRPSWSMIGFDIDDAGKPLHLKPVAGNGNAALAAASMAAIGDSRFAPGARVGCQYPYRVGAGTMPAPPMPEEAGFRTAGATCPAKAEWAVGPVLTYPEMFRRRAVEGWAVIGYDVAPWGQTGNVHVLAAQPAEEFGAQAVQLLAIAKRVPSATGYTGCVDRVKFRMGPTARAPGAPPVMFDPPQPAY
ncbi:MAG: energy transducer TonB [Sphingomonas sp.]|nr:MAG: energy transducer TonB [Sphingomonas sp.]